MEPLTVLIECARQEAGAIEVVLRDRSGAVGRDAQARIDERWADYVAEAGVHGRTLFDGPISCFAGAEIRGSRLVLYLTPGDYKTFLVTVLRDRAWFLEHAPGVMMAGLGNSVLLTHGGEGLLGIRSPRVSAYAGRAHLIGGVLEELGTPGHPSTAEGIVAHLRREMMEEAGVTERDLCGAPKLLAVVRDQVLAQPELIWQWELAVPVAEVGKRLGALEHSGWVSISEGNKAVHWERMTPVARSAWQRRAT
jgi:hypothetical protein